MKRLDEIVSICNVTISDGGLNEKCLDEIVLIYKYYTKSIAMSFIIKFRSFFAREFLQTTR